MDIEFEVGGHKVPPERLTDAIQDAVIQHYKRRLQSVRCPVHGKQLKVVITGRTAEEVSVDFQGCCRDLLTKAAEAIRE